MDKFEIVADIGMPEIKPLEDKVNPEGNEPLIILYL